MPFRTVTRAYLTSELSLLQAIAVKLALLSLSLYIRLAKALSAIGLKLTSAVALYCFLHRTAVLSDHVCDICSTHYSQNAVK